MPDQCPTIWRTMSDLRSCTPWVQLCQTSVHIDMDMTVERHCTNNPGCLVHSLSGCIITCTLRLGWIWEGTSWPVNFQ